MDLIRIILAIFLPPVAVFLKVGLAMQFWLNLLLTLFFFVPGVIHAIWVLVKK
ncbi:MAG: YqaE/Pmp3 family membrane protein [Kordiimonadaceae bacterium]|nr:YqaE/Pmp3 family membrane protein [Kordiimonadaceae bacterium]MBO6570361.1 YqaE/Pmp3 family membrane protein [Kordiimonadaceae bacterium]MBO6965541.1 YqaE/Pmp3 family membrane protein [Kordiimonadaceae bacterium]